jgi:hypothetical protein
MHVKFRNTAARSERAAQHLLLLALFTVPFSTWLTNVFAGLALIAFLVALAGGQIARDALRRTPVLLALALLAFLVLAASWSIAPRADIHSALSKYMRLLMLPLAIGLCWRNPLLGARGMKMFMGGALVLATSCYLVALDMMPTSDLGWWRVGNQLDAFSFKNHITIGILLAFATVASLVLALHAATTRRRLAAFAMGVYFLVPMVFLTQGRTGYVALFVGLVALLLRVRATPLRMAAGAAGIVLMFALFYATSSTISSCAWVPWSEEMHSGHAHIPEWLSHASYMLKSASNCGSPSPRRQRHRILRRRLCAATRGLNWGAGQPFRRSAPSASQRIPADRRAAWADRPRAVPGADGKPCCVRRCGYVQHRNRPAGRCCGRFTSAARPINSLLWDHNRSVLVPDPRRLPVCERSAPGGPPALPIWRLLRES